MRPCLIVDAASEAFDILQTPLAWTAIFGDTGGSFGRLLSGRLRARLLVDIQPLLEEASCGRWRLGALGF